MKQIKLELKALASKIRQTKDKTKETMRAGNYAGVLQSETIKLKREFRYQHIVYCLLRGRTLEQIEPNSTADADLIDHWMSLIKATLESAK